MGFGRIRSMRWVWLIVALLLSVGARAAEPLSIYCERWQGFCEPDGRGFYFDLVRAYINGGVRGPFNQTARREAGFSDAELSRLEMLDTAKSEFA